MRACLTAARAAGLSLALLAALTFAATAVLGWRITDESDPEPRRIFQGEALMDNAPPADLAGVVSDVDGEYVQVRVDETLVSVRVGSEALIQRLTPITPAEVRAGEWVIVGAIDDNSLTLVLQAVVVAAPDEVAP
ncbi:MAG: hypothetical protein OXG19_07330 [Chloroflexi bacterium]|nr:hypothetical protein [Chloroflexota bacterium]